MTFVWDSFYWCQNHPFQIISGSPRVLIYQTPEPASPIHWLPAWSSHLVPLSMHSPGYRSLLHLPSPPPTHTHTHGTDEGETEVSAIIAKGFERRHVLCGLLSIFQPWNFVRNTRLHEIHLKGCSSCSITHVYGLFHHVSAGWIEGLANASQILFFSPKWDDIGNMVQI